MNTGHYTSRLFSSIVGVEHGVTMRSLGDARKNHVGWYIGAEQVHGSTVAFADKSTMSPIPNADGLVTNATGVRIGVRTADCVPILMADVHNTVVSAVHAGWKGIRQGVVSNAVRAMISSGARLDSLVVFIGPHIGGCCYTVDEERAKKFHTRYVENGAWHIDIGAEVLKELDDAGIARDQIDAPVTCTSCQNDLFFSFRKDSKETFGEMLSYISLA